MRAYEGKVINFDTAVEPLTDRFYCYVLNVYSEKRAFVNFGKGRLYDVGAGSRLFLNFKNEKQVWQEKQIKLPFVKKNGRAEFDLPAYLDSIGIPYRINDHYDFYSGDNTGYDMFYCKNAMAEHGSFQRPDYSIFWMNVIFLKVFLKINGKGVRRISIQSSCPTDKLLEYVKAHLEQPADISYTQLCELLKRFMIRPESHDTEIFFRDRTTVKGNMIDWENNCEKQ